MKARGAELSSAVDAHSGRELLWCGDPDIWSGTAPILFPVVGRMRGGGIEVNGKFYPMPTHGFAAHSTFELVTSSPRKLILALHDSEQTRASYPFRFRLQVAFSLYRNVLSVDYVVENPAEAPLIFSLGSHPAFALPAATMEEAQAEVRFDSSAGARCHRIRNNLLGPAERSPLQGNRLPLTGDTFAEDAIILRDLNANRVALYATGERLISMDTGGMPHLGLWAKPNAPYLCIEPWITTDDGTDAPLDIARKPGFIHLAPDQQYRTGYRIML